MVKRRKAGSDAESAVEKAVAVKEGGTVVLHGGYQRILIKDVKSLGQGKLRGTIFGFSPSFTHEYEGLTIGERLLFDADDIVNVLTSTSDA